MARAMVSVVPPAGAPTQILTGATAVVWAHAQGIELETLSAKIRPTHGLTLLGRGATRRNAMRTWVSAVAAKQEKNVEVVSMERMGVGRGK
jgi:hypothetical protein